MHKKDVKGSFTPYGKGKCGSLGAIALFALFLPCSPHSCGDLYLLFGLTILSCFIGRKYTKTNRLKALPKVNSQIIRGNNGMESCCPDKESFFVEQTIIYLLPRKPVTAGTSQKGVEGFKHEKNPFPFPLMLILPHSAIPELVSML